jgi:drug/metabolite transporter (DMT)-like permease
VGHIYIALTILLTVYGQLVVKQQIDAAGPPPAGPDQIVFFLRFILRPLVASALTAAFLASLCWMAALARFELSYAYPFMSLSFVAVAGCSFLLFRESMSPAKILGLALICLGVFLVSRAEAPKSLAGTEGARDGSRNTVQQTLHGR